MILHVASDSVHRGTLAEKIVCPQHAEGAVCLIRGITNMRDLDIELPRAVQHGSAEVFDVRLGVFVLFVLNLAVFPSEPDFANCHGI
jgi:hypothetical protein